MVSSDKSSSPKKRKSSVKHKTKNANTPSTTSTVSSNKNDSHKKLANQKSPGPPTGMTARKNQSSTVETLNAYSSLDPDVLRWENPCEDPVDEMRRIQVYKANRRLRYMNSNNSKIAMLSVKDQQK